MPITIQTIGFFSLLLIEEDGAAVAGEEAAAAAAAPAVDAETEADADEGEDDAAAALARSLAPELLMLSSEVICRVYTNVNGELALLSLVR